MKWRKFEAFSLVELMIAVGIIRVLATLALPRFKQFQAKAKMGEAKSTLNHIFTLQQAYMVTANQYQAFTPMGADLTNVNQINCNVIPLGARNLGFRIEPCPPSQFSPVPRYSYRAQTKTDIRQDFLATASTGNLLNNRVCPGNNQHVIAIDERRIFGQAARANARDFTNPTQPTEPSVGIVCRR